MYTNINFVKAVPEIITGWNTIDSHADNQIKKYYDKNLETY